MRAMNTRIGAGLFVPAAALLLWAGCSLHSAGVDSDAGPQPDAISACSLSIGYDQATPVEAGSLVVATAYVTESGPIAGERVFEWLVSRDTTEAISVDPLDATASQASFPVARSGNYFITLIGEIGGVPCTGATDVVTAIEPDALFEHYRFRFVPTQSQAAPVQEHVIGVWGGVDAYLDESSLFAGSPAAGTVVDDSAAPLSAYLRVTPLGGVDPFPIETFADDLGGYGLRVSSQLLYDVLVVPDDGARAPVLMAGVAAPQLGTIVVDAGDTITGTVLDAAGQPIAGARVTARVGGVPSTIGVTDSAGAFAIRARFAATPASLVVVPPDGSGLPRLELDSSAGWVAGADAITVRYAASLTARTVSVTATGANGSAPAPGARVTWSATSMGEVGTVTPFGGQAMPATGSVRISAVAGPGGVVPATVLPETTYDVVVEPPEGAALGDGVSIASADLSQGNPAAALVSLAAPATVWGLVADQQLIGLSGVRVTAIPIGVLAGTTASAATKVTGGDGTYGLSLVGGGEYRLVYDAADRLHGRGSQDIVAPDAGGSQIITAVALDDAVRVHGRVKIGGSPAANVLVRLYCLDCSDDEATVPLAEAVSAGNGDFVIAVPDPGVAQ